MSTSEKPIENIDPVIREVVKALEDYRSQHPEERTASIALEGILHELTGEILADASDPQSRERMIRLLEELADLFPESTVPYRNLAKTFMGLNEYTDALRYIEAGLRVDPENEDLVFDHALCLLEMEEYHDAIRGFERYLELDDSNPWAYCNLGTIYRSLGDFQQAEKHYKHALRLDRDFAPAHYSLAMLYMDIGEWERVAHHAEIALRKDPWSKDIYLALGDASMALKRPEIALMNLQQAAMIDVNFVEAYETMSAAYTDLGMYELAIAAGNEVLKRNPESWMALANIGYAFSKQEMWEKSIEYQLAALKKDPSEESAYKICWDLGWCYLQLDDYDKAMEFTDMALSMKDDPDLILLLNKGLILLAQGKEDEANVIYDEALEQAKGASDLDDVMEGLRDIKDFMVKRDQSVDKLSAFFKLIKG
jgi:tetratricopeptide (TPR) repeat protein